MGNKNIYVSDETGRILFVERADPVREPVSGRVDVSGHDWVRIGLGDIGGEPIQPREFVRFLKVEFIPAP